MSTFGEKLKMLREERNIKQNEVAAIFMINRSTYGKWENDASKPDIDTLTKLANYFNVSVDYLLGNTNFRTKDELFAHWEKTYNPDYSLAKEVQALEQAEQELTPEEIDKIKSYKEYLIHQRKKN